MGLPTPPYRRVDSAGELAAAAGELGLPLAVKPSREGSSIGISRVDEASQASGAVSYTHLDVYKRQN